MSKKDSNQSMQEALTRKISDTRDPSAEDQMREAMQEDREGAHDNPSGAQTPTEKAMSNEFELDESTGSDHSAKDAMTEKRKQAQKKPDA